ncbi:hypothetical protein RFI_00107 [Reticulomyxa filosa]|uniref:Enoyl reductase (ER) domain-containing protein n=1 Tax=Reticulomyxa filosa TaxID=46433 RepID=X6PFT3_RETFI|nr:hypothetical protein RFI_00107 [Reticulomyxa filosa]|eukprot:ETO36953.1 hypothetical protein RFI_00107 [Reticulomyxa filosa]
MYDIIYIFVLSALIGLVPLWLFYKKLLKLNDPPKAKSLKQAAISIPGAGGFDRLCITDSVVTLGANIENCKSGIYSKVPKEALLQNKDTYVMVEIHSIGINYADCCIRWGLYESAKEYVGWPITPGFEFSGKVVEIIGKDTANNRFKIGDEVFGVSLFGAYSTHVVVPIKQLFHKPSELTMDECGGFLCTAITAYYALFELGGLHFLPHIQTFTAEKAASFYKFEHVSQVTKRPPAAVLIHSASG